MNHLSFLDRMCYSSTSFLFILIIINYVSLNNALIIKDKSSKLLRHKRFIVFPEGASFGISVSQSFHFARPVEVFSEGWNMHTIYNLPGNSSLLHELPRALMMRKKRSAFYKDLEYLLNLNQIDGRSCIYRTLCEVGQQLPKKNYLLDAFMNVLFHFPIDNIFDNEPKHHHEYSSAHILGLEGHNCENLYPKCPFSLLDIQPEFFP